MSWTGRSSSQPREATAARTLPGEESIPTSFKTERTHPVIVVLEAALTGPATVMKSSSNPVFARLSSDLLRRALIQVIGQSQMLGCLDSFHPDCLKCPRSVFEPKTGHRIIVSPRFVKKFFDIFNKVRSLMRRPKINKSKAVLLETSKKDRFCVPVLNQSSSR